MINPTVAIMGMKLVGILPSDKAQFTSYAEFIRMGDLDQGGLELLELSSNAPPCFATLT